MKQKQREESEEEKGGKSRHVARKSKVYEAVSCRWSVPGNAPSEAVNIYTGGA